MCLFCAVGPKRSLQIHSRNSVSAAFEGDEDDAREDDVRDESSDEADEDDNRYEMSQQHGGTAQNSLFRCIYCQKEFSCSNLDR